MFGEAADYQRFLSSMERFCGETEVKICAYCLMENHVHLLVCDPEGHTPLIMKKPAARFHGALWSFRWCAVCLVGRRSMRRS